MQQHLLIDFFSFFNQETSFDSIPDEPPPPPPPPVPVDEPLDDLSEEEVEAEPEAEVVKPEKSPRDGAGSAVPPEVSKIRFDDFLNMMEVF